MASIPAITLVDQNVFEAEGFVVDVLSEDSMTYARGYVSDYIEGKGLLVDCGSPKMPQRLIKFSDAGRFSMVHRATAVDLAAKTVIRAA